MYRGAGVVVGGVCGLHVVVLVVNCLCKCGGAGGGAGGGAEGGIGDTKNSRREGHVEESVAFREKGGNNNDTSINS